MFREMFKSKDPFKKKTAKEMLKFFDHVPDGIVLWTHEVFYFAAVGVVSSYGTEAGGKMMEEFTKFLSKCEQIAAEEAKAEDTLKKDPAYVDPNTWTWSKN